MWNVKFVTFFVLLATVQGSLTDQELADLADLVSCPFVAAEIKHGRLIPEDGKWTRDQAEAVISTYLGPVADDYPLMGRMTLGPLRQLLVSSIFGVTGKESPLPWESMSFMHSMHTGIRLSNITDQPDAWKKPCNKPELGPWSTDPSCGEPGVRPEVFDHYADLLGKGPNDKWTKDDVLEMCTRSTDLFYQEGSSYPIGGQPSFMGQPLCKGVYGAAAVVFGSITTLEWKAFLTESTYPADYTVQPHGTASGALMAGFTVVFWVLPIVAYFQAH